MDHHQPRERAAMDEDTYYPSDTDLDFSFTSTTTDRTITSSSARTSLTSSSLNLSFNDRFSTSTTTNTSSTTLLRPHRKSDPNWAGINAATNLSSDGTLHLRHLKLLRHLGTGNLGRVFLCCLRDYDGANFALKVIDKNSLTAKKLSHVQTEAQILSSLDHPFLPTLYAHLEVSHYTCFLIDYCPNGDLHSLLHKQPGNRLPLPAIRFFSAEVLVALEYLHAKGIVYRDLKPENVLIREDGHVMLSDFDLCFKSNVTPTFENQVNSVHKRRYHVKEVRAEFAAEPTTAFSRSCVGTHEYLAPELITGKGHGNGVDWWAFGVFIYELLYGNTPFKGSSKQSTIRNIASNKGVRFDASAEGVGMGDAMDLIERLLVKDPRRRLGCQKGATDIKQHSFFEGIKWPLIRTYRPPEVRALVRKGKAHLGYVNRVGVYQKRKRWWWKALSYFMKSKEYKLNSNSNSYTYCNKIRKDN